MSKASLPAIVLVSGGVLFVAGGFAPAMADHSYTPDYSIVTWNSSVVPSGSGAWRKWRERLEGTYRRGFRPGSTSCVSSPFSAGCGVTFFTGGQVLWAPAEFRPSLVGSSFASSFMRSVRVENAAINIKTGGKEMNLSVKVAFDGESLGGNSPLRRTTLLWAPDRNYQRNLAMQCQKAPYRATGYNGFKRSAVWGLTREFRFDTDVSPCDAGNGILAYGQDEVWSGESGTVERTINTGDFPNPVEMVVLSGDIAAAYVRCSRTTKKCDWTYPSLWEAVSFKNNRQVQQVRTSKKYAADNSGEYKDTVHAGWVKNFTNADMIKSQPIRPSQDIDLTVAAQSMVALIGACEAAPVYLSSIQSNSGLSGLSGSQIAKVKFADNCLKNSVSGGRWEFFPATVVVHPKSLGRTDLGNDPTSVCNFLSPQARQDLAGQLTRLGLTRTSYCYSQD